MKSTVLLFVIMTSLCHTSVSCARILAFLPYIGKSHFAFFEPYIMELAARGHQMVVVSHFPQKKPIANYTDISLVGSIQTNATDRMDLKEWEGISKLKTMIRELSVIRESCEQTLSFHAVQNLLKSEEKFDLVITETFIIDCFLPFAHKFKVPNIALSSCALFPWSNDRMGNPINPSYIPTHGVPFSDKMDFVERLINTVGNILLNSLFTMQRYMTEGYVRKHFGEDVPSLSDLARNTSLLLVNSHFSLARPRPLVPGIVDVGGLHIKPPNKLPKDLEDYLNGAEHGVIYFSMGSMIRTETLPVEKRDAFLQAFSELPQRVLWKWEGDVMPGKPENVKLSKWLPQFDVLNHPKVRVFVGHGGLLGTIEAVHAGVPMLGIPMIGDQPMNIKAIETVGMAVTLDLSDVTKESVLKALRALLNESSYKENAMRMSRLYQDRPMSAMDTAIYWTEYVIRHKGAPHMRPAVLDLAWYQYLLLDVLAVIFLSLTSVFLCIYFTVRKLLRICSSQSKTKLKQS